jgi:TatD DNase family protein
MLIDTHAHLDFPAFDADREDVIARATQAGVTEIIAMSTRVETSVAAVKIAESHPKIWAAVGIHPLEVADVPADAIERLRELAASPRVVAIGEIGLDYHALDASPASQAVKLLQADIFEKQLTLAAELKLNVVLHIRECFQPEVWADTLRIMEPFHGRLRAVFHCFKGTPPQVEEVAAHGHLVSFTGFVTYPQMPQLAATAAVIDARHFMLETDCPFQHPMPESDRRCEPDSTRTVAECIAQLRGISLEELARQTTENAHQFFQFQRS